MDVEVVADDGSPPPEKTTPKPAPPPAAPTKGRITKTRHHTKTVTEPIVTVTNYGAAAPSPNVVVKTVFTETFITVTRTV